MDFQFDLLDLNKQGEVPQRKFDTGQRTCEQFMST